MKNPVKLGEVQLFGGTAATRAACHTQFPEAPIGSLYVSTSAVATTKPNLYVKISATAWERVVTQAAD